MTHLYVALFTNHRAIFWRKQQGAIDCWFCVVMIFCWWKSMLFSMNWIQTEKLWQQISDLWTWTFLVFFTTKKLSENFWTGLVARQKWWSQIVWIRRVIFWHFPFSQLNDNCLTQHTSTLPWRWWKKLQCVLKKKDLLLTCFNQRKNTCFNVCKSNRS